MAVHSALLFPRRRGTDLNRQAAKDAKRGRWMKTASSGEALIHHRASKIPARTTEFKHLAKF
jgi:hypothetical protein